MTREEQKLHKKLNQLLQASPTQAVTFKNYKDLCNQLSLPVKSGNAKSSQLSSLLFFCDIHKAPKGNSYSFSYVVPSPDELMLQEKGIASTLESILKLHFLSTRSSHRRAKYLFTPRDLWSCLGFINDEKYGNPIEERKYILQTEASAKQLEYFKECAARRFKDIISSTLKTLEKSSLIAQTSIYIVGTANTKREATNEEIQFVKSIETSLLSSYSLTSINQVFIRNKSQEFYTKRKELIQKEHPGWEYFVKGFKIIPTPQWLNTETLSSIEEQQLLSNYQIKLLLDKTIETKRQNYLTKPPRSEDYEKYMSEIINKYFNGAYNTFIDWFIDIEHS